MTHREGTVAEQVDLSLKSGLNGIRKEAAILFELLGNDSERTPASIRL